MITVEIGNTVAIEWRVTRNGAPEDFGGKSLSLFIVGPYARLQVNTFTVEGNLLRFSFFGAEQKHVGKYGFELIENDGKGNMSTLRLCDALCLARCSCGSVDVITLDSEITLPANGLSAYEIAVKEGFVGTEEEWIESLKQPAIDAAARADAAAKAANEAADSANKAATSANSAADKATAAATAANDAATKAENAGDDASAAATAATAAATAANAAAQAATAAASSATAAAQAASTAAGKANTAAGNADRAAGSADMAAKNAQAAANTANTAADAADKAAKAAQTATEAATAAAKAANDAAQAAIDALATIDKKIADAVAVETDRAMKAEAALGKRIDDFKEKDPEFEKWKNGISLALGHNAKSVNYSTAIGENASAQFAGAIALGNNALVTKGREITLGGNNKSDTNTFFSIPSPSATKDKRANFYEQSLDGTVRIPNLPNKEADGLGDLQPYLAELAGGGALRPLFESMPNVKWNAATKMYDVWKDKGGISVTEEQMAAIYNNSLGSDCPSVVQLLPHGVKAIIPKTEWIINKSLTINVFQSNSCEFFAFSANVKNFGDTFSIGDIYVATKLRCIYNTLYCGSSKNYKALASIEDISIIVDKKSVISINIGKSSKINYTSCRFIPDNVKGDTYSNTTTITVDALPYSLLTGTATPEQYEATGHTQEEWQSIQTDSTAKGITFTQALESSSLYTQQTRFRRALSEPTHIEGNEIVAATGKALHRVGSDVYFDRATLLSGETVSDFVEIVREEALAIIRAKDAEEAAKHQPIEEATE